MNNLMVATTFAIAGVLSWFWPELNGVYFSPAEIREGDGRIVSAIFLVCAALFGFIRAPSNH